MPDTDNTPDRLQLIGVRNAHFDAGDTEEAPDYGFQAAMRLTKTFRLNLLERAGRGDPIPELTLTRAITEPEAAEWAQIVLKRAFRDGKDQPKPDIESEIAELWKRLPRARDPKVALSYQRMIHQLTIFLGWIDWRHGQPILEGFRNGAAQDIEREREEQALAPWSDALSEG
ncbi:hypothetical protein JI664_21335 [Rhodobacter sp. NTK016B]|uniref:hypothetical protein n=1 Tax=Rhodobacter sp. NTK016B TaxID=2759676 RepID=UPI001A8D523D|nr:hypothetical protein [Rhodobacter sp. NTK016B]MBN8294530.1 hypothetical protein [Rhodobacter sp. NTK016B]